MSETCAQRKQPNIHMAAAESAPPKFGRGSDGPTIKEMNRRLNNWLHRHGEAKTAWPVTRAARKAARRKMRARTRRAEAVRKCSKKKEQPTTNNQ